jgi:hypothetical protein
MIKKIASTGVLFPQMRPDRHGRSVDPCAPEYAVLVEQIEYGRVDTTDEHQPGIHCGRHLHRHLGFPYLVLADHSKSTYWVAYSAGGSPVGLDPRHLSYASTASRIERYDDRRW